MNEAASSTPLGIIAGGGPLPGRVAAAAQAAGRAVFIVALEGFAEKPVVAPWPHRAHRMGAVGQILGDLRAHGCRDLVLIGPVRRPSFRDLRPDAEGLKVMARVGRAAFAGDDGLLAAVMRILGEEGFRVIGAHEVLSEALAPAGLLTVSAPDARAAADIARGVAVARALGALDVGQGCVVQQGLVLAVEAIEGTDAMLERAGALRREGVGGVLVKLLKPGQDQRADMPTLGPRTVERARQAGLRGIAYQAHGALFTERAASIAAADEAGLFLLGIDPTREGNGS